MVIDPGFRLPGFMVIDPGFRLPGFMVIDPGFHPPPSPLLTLVPPPSPTRMHPTFPCRASQAAIKDGNNRLRLVAMLRVLNPQCGDVEVIHELHFKDDLEEGRWGRVQVAKCRWVEKV